MTNTKKQLKNEIEEYIIANNMRSELVTRNGDLFILMDIEEEEDFGYALDSVEWDYKEDYVICQECGDAIHKYEDKDEDILNGKKFYTCQPCICEPTFLC